MPDLIAEALIEAILHGKFKGGVQLKQDEIAKQFDVSLIPVREALIQLEGKKLVSSVRNKGTVVAALSLEEMKELLEVRKILEIGCVMLQPKQLNDEIIEKMAYIIEKMNQGPNAYLFSRYNRLFYELFCDLCDNTQMKATYEHIMIRVERYLMYMYHLLPDQVMQTTQYKTILRLVKEGKKEELKQFIPGVVEQQEHLFINYLKDQGKVGHINFNDFLPFPNN